MIDKPLTLYVDPSWKREAIHSPLMQPWWGNPWGKDSLFAMEMFNAFPFDSSVYCLTEKKEEAEMVFMPYRHAWVLKNDRALLDICARVSQESGLPLLIDGAGDVEYSVGIPHAHVLRIGGYRFLSEEGRVIIPPASDDLLERCRGGALDIRKKSEGKPVIGFAGWAELTLKQRVRTTVKELPVRVYGLFDSRYRAIKKGVLWRGEALRLLGRSSLVTLKVKSRSSFSGSAKTAAKDLSVLREELVDVVLGSDYALDVRGDANASTRLFEILSLGRIPVIVDTERNFPFSDEVDYREFCLFVDFSDLPNIAQIVSNFHKNVTPEQFENMQRKAREAFVRYFRTDAQMRHIVNRLRKLL
jgi:hypothetical protein